MDFEIIEKISDQEVIAIGNSIREINRLRKIYGQGHWRKLECAPETGTELGIN